MKRMLMKQLMLNRWKRRTTNHKEALEVPAALEVAALEVAALVKVAALEVVALVTVAAALEVTAVVTVVIAEVQVIHFLLKVQMKMMTVNKLIRNQKNPNLKRKVSRNNITKELKRLEGLPAYSAYSK